MTELTLHLHHHLTEPTLLLPTLATTHPINNHLSITHHLCILCHLISSSPSITHHLLKCNMSLAHHLPLHTNHLLLLMKVATIIALMMQDTTEEAEAVTTIEEAIEVLATINKETVIIKEINHNMVKLTISGIAYKNLRSAQASKTGVAGTRNRER